MKMVFRWFGEGNDQVPLKYIKQIPGVEGVVWALHDIPPGEAWPMNKIMEVKKQAEAHGFHTDVVESVNVHEDIKLGRPSRDKYIDNYKVTIERLAKAGVKVICYNFMPVFDWVRTDLEKSHDDGSTALFFESDVVKNMRPGDIVNKILQTKDFTMPGWEPERLSHLTQLFDAYQNVTEERLWENLRYFLEAIIPVAKAHDVKMAIHPDDPPWSVFGLPRIINNKENISRLLQLVDSPYNGITFCTGSLGADPNNDVQEMARMFMDRIHFAHVRNLKRFANGDFIETSHRNADGSLDVVGVMKIFHDHRYAGYLRPDHGRHIWDEKGRPGYGLYDRALGIMYLWGIWDSFAKMRKEAEHDRIEQELKR